MFKRFVGDDGQLILHDGYIWVTRENLSPSSGFSHPTEPRRAPLHAIELLTVFRGSRSRPACVHVMARGDNARLGCTHAACNGPGGVRFGGGTSAPILDALVASFTDLGIEVREARHEVMPTRPPRPAVMLRERSSPARTSGNESAAADGLQWYLKRIRRVDLLTADEEVELSRSIEAGLYASHLLEAYPSRTTRPAPAERRDLRQIVQDGRSARTRMIEANLRLVVSTAQNYEGRGLDMLDLVQEGNTGLIRAVEKFDYRLGNKFSTYATWWIRQAITRGIADKSRTIRLPVHVVEDLSRMTTVRVEGEIELGRALTDAEVAQRADLTLEKVRELDDCDRTVLSIEALTDSDDGAGLDIEDDCAHDPYEALHRADVRERIDIVLETLTEREAGVMKLRHGLVDGVPRTLEEIGKVYKVTRERIRQIEAKTLQLLREPSRADELRPFDS
ncbi:sigma-70 family RNA polymerase sigma factor [Rhodococcus hoagii]|uniref:RNA polymerase sigma factor SigB n=2 Tax=Rhodococcus hoagii TaxID=43767 RepID=E9SXP1_RHOHA|nr:sigma-70 family RNA polymerase sigma factor [Rhodococcus sp. SGAir0479]EGD25325.1 Sigma-70 region 2 [Prescottella equi ATCC 33707]NKZ67059.1 sigma-70 family RNA polymerase sigma factor [Prescottella equi]QCQ90481.1 sigma-70 family RNA polymerase sigma factor [Rhodococcus sp. SGAir0479]BCN48381.1 hypothetical protein RE9416_16820 [Prescottella equi]